MNNGVASDQTLYNAFLTVRTIGGQPRVEAVREVADSYGVPDDDVMEAIDRVREDRGLQPIEW